MSLGDKKAKEYLTFLLKIIKECENKFHQDKDKVWVRYYEKVSKSGYKIKNLPKLFALIHPRFYYSRGKSFKKNLTWERNSSFVSGITKTDKCQAKIYTDYKCPFNKYPDIRGKCEADHQWPNALGGPSILDNRLLLCKFHNGMKSNSISNFNWNEIPSWLEKYLKKIYAFKL